MPDDNDYDNAFDWYGIPADVAAEIYAQLAIESEAQTAARSARDEYAELHKGVSSARLREIWERSMALTAHTFKDDGK